MRDTECLADTRYLTTNEAKGAESQGKGLSVTFSCEHTLF